MEIHIQADSNNTLTVLDLFRTGRAFLCHVIVMEQMSVAEFSMTFLAEWFPKPL